MPEVPEFEYDVFLSHSSKDKPIVRELAERLRADGLRVWLDEWIIKPGDMIGLQVEKGLENSRTLVLLMSANAFASDWVTLERHTVLFRDPTNALRRFVPIRIDDAPIGDMLRQYAHVEWRDRSEDQYQRLKDACRHTSATLGTEIAGENIAAQDRPVLVGHDGGVSFVAMSADGRKAVSSSLDNTLRVWDLVSNKCISTLEGHTGEVMGVALSTDGRKIVSASYDNTLRVWNLDSNQCIATLKGHTSEVWAVALSADGRTAVSASNDKTLRVWNLDSNQCLTSLKGHTSRVFGIALSADGRKAVSGADDYTVRVWDLDFYRCIATLKGHTGTVVGVAMSADGRTAVSGAADSTLRVWDLASNKCIATLKGHTSFILAIALSADGRKAVSASHDNTLRVWNLDSNQCIATLEGHTSEVWGVALSADGRTAVSASNDKSLRIWDLSQIAPTAPNEKNIVDAEVYTNAKVLMVGDSGVGKSGLTLRLTEKRYEATSSTDGAWATQVKLPHDALRAKSNEREIWLWDFAGQHDYRLTHQLFMDETSLTVYVFNPQSANPFEGIAQWDQDLLRAARRPFQKLLVAGRCDRGGMTVSQTEVEEFVEKHGFARYLETSALTSAGCDDLYDAIINSIPWEDIPYTSSPRIFKLLKDNILKLRDTGIALLRMGELKQRLEMHVPQETFTIDQLRTVVSLLVGPGVVWPLGFGDFVLLQPEYISQYAAALVRKIRKHTDEIGSIEEDQVLAGDLDYQDMTRLPEDVEKEVLRALCQTLVERGLCLKEPTEDGEILVFPSLYKRERPDVGDHPSAFVTYRFQGALDEVYTTLVVRLLHTRAFDKERLWKFAADFRTHSKKRIGLKMTRRGEEGAELTIYFEPSIPDDTKVTFVRYVHDHLQKKAVDIERVRHYVCPHAGCGETIEGMRAIRRAIENNKKEIPCQFCGQQIPLWDLLEEKFASDEMRQKVRDMDEKAQINIDNESRELILVGHAFAIAGEAGHIFRPTPNSDWGIDGEIEFKNKDGEASGVRVYLQLKSGDSYLYPRKTDRTEIFKVKKPRQAEYWQAQAYPVMLVIRTSNGEIRWMNVTDYLNRPDADRKQIVFDGEPFSALNVFRLGNRLLGETIV